MLLTSAPPVIAQEDEDDAGGPLVRLLENTLSTDDRNINVVGLKGALSSTAQIEKIEVSDVDGIWLRISGAELDWNRLALLRGRFSVNALKADAIEVMRKPIPAPADPDIPAPETTPFQVPELPVSVEIGTLMAGRIALGPEILGQAAEMSLAGAVSLVDGALDTNLDLQRLDRPGDQIKLLAKFSNETRQITADLNAVEDEGGLISSLIRIPGNPALQLTVKGDGPVTDFTADIALSTEGTDRFAGTVRLQEVDTPTTAGTDSDTDGRSIAFTADLGGDVTPMLPPRFHAFFGPDTRLRVDGRSDPDGRIDLSDLSLTAQELGLDGKLSIAPGGVVDMIDLDGKISPSKGDTVLLPLAEQTTLGGAAFSVQQDRSVGPDWTLSLHADDLSRPDLTLESAKVDITGTLDQTEGLSLDGTVIGRLSGLVFADPALQNATGPDIALRGQFATNGTGALTFSDMTLTGADYRAEVDGALTGLDSGFAMDGTVNLRAADLSRFSGLAKRDLGGAATVAFDGKGSPLGGDFDFDLKVLGQDLEAGIAQVDTLLTGNSTLSLSAARGGQGLDIRAFALDTSGLTARAKGQLRSSDSALTFESRLADLGQVIPEMSGPLSLTGDLTQTGTVWAGDVALRGPHQSHADLTGSFDPSGPADIDFDAAFAQIERFVPQLSGTLSAKGKVTRKGGIWGSKAELKGPQSSFARLDGTFDPNGNADFHFDAAFDQIERFLPELRGTLTAKGDAKRSGSQWTFDSDATGPSGITARLGGSFDETTGLADIAAKGQLRLDTASLFIAPNQVRGLAQFDMRLQGKPGLDALSGTITSDDTTLAIPAAAQSLENIDARITLAQSRATIAATGNLRAGGAFRATGPVSLQPPFDGRIDLDLIDLVITDKVSVESSANGRISMAGPLAGGAAITGQITFGETNINLNAVAGGAGAAPIPEITHIGEPAAVRATRDKAGLIQTEKKGGASVAYPLDIDLLAPKKVFANGFGLQSELGGAINIGGTTASVIPTGQIALIRGTLDLIGRRLKLTKGLVTLQGDLSPYVEFESTSTTSEGQATFELAGPLDAPKIRVYADPERPAEEALAMLLFGNRFTELSPFVIAQMAASLASLAGAGNGAKNKAKKKAGVDVLDIGADESGAGRVGAGAYLSDNIYTDFSVNTRGETELNLNLDITDSLTAKGTVDGTGDSKLGIFFERDY